MNATRICSIEHCATTTRRKELCDKHYRRNRLNGDPLITKRPGLELSPAERLARGTNKAGDCWIWTAGGVRYGKTSVEGKSTAVHVLAYELSNGPVPEGLVVRHSCDTPKCVKPAHLSVGTPAQNSRDMTTRDRQAKGIRQGSAKMTDATVMDCREAYFSGSATVTQLARQYGITNSAIGKIVTFKTWKHVTSKEQV
jgi:hypothetical protein